MHKRLTEEQARQLQEARRRAEAAVDDAKAQLAADAALAKTTLAQESDRLADQIAESILRRSAA
jgi:hypothetical protein